jgi:hypothetical protein
LHHSENWTVCIGRNDKDQEERALCLRRAFAKATLLTQTGSSGSAVLKAFGCFRGANDEEAMKIGLAEVRPMLRARSPSSRQRASTASSIRTALPSISDEQAGVWLQTRRRLMQYQRLHRLHQRLEFCGSPQEGQGLEAVAISIAASRTILDGEARCTWKDAVRIALTGAGR